MKTAFRAALVGGLLACAMALAAPALAADPLKVGAAKTDITPTDLTGAEPDGRRQLHPRARSHLRPGPLSGERRHRAAIVSVDLIEVGDMTPLRQRIEREVGVPFNAIMITATHDHSAPRIGDVSPGALAHPGGPESRAYTQATFDRIVAALKTAKASAQPARYGLGKGHADVNVNRDLYTAKGWGMGFNPDGPSDKTVWAARFETLGGKPIAVLFNYAVHNDVTLGAGEVTGDLSGVAQNYVEDSLGDGRRGPVDHGPGRRPGPARLPACGHGRRFARPGARLSRRRGAGRDGRRRGGPRGARDQRSVADSAPGRRRPRGVVPDQEGRQPDGRHDHGPGPEVKLRLGLILLDDIAFTSVSGEVVTNIYEHLGRASPLTNTIMITLANDRVGYIADDAAYDRPIFEVNGSPMARGCAETPSSAAWSR
jgi:neutral ceramidase